MNLLFKASESFDNFQGKLVEKLAKSELIDKLIVISRSSDIPKNLDNVVEYPSSIGWGYKYRYTKEYEESEPLSRELLEKVQPFMATAMAIATRDTNFDIYSTLEARRLVYISIRYWYAIIKNNQIDYMLFSYIPHTLHEYVIYLLGKAFDIPMLVYAETHIPYICIWGHSLEDIGENISKYFKEKETKNDTTIKNIFLKEFLDKIRSYEIPVLRSHKELREARNNANIEIHRFIKPKNIFIHYYSLIKVTITRRRKFIKECEKKYLHDLLRSVKCYLMQKSVSYYNKRADYPDYSSPYIYFGLQLTPEATTLPNAGVFDEQLLSIKILAQAAKNCGVRVYVKEHYVQSRRDAYFYKELFKIDNVTCIKTDVASMPLIENAVAVSTQTGSCIIEGFIKKKHSLVFGVYYCWKNLPGLHIINNVKQCEHIIKEILENTTPITDEIIDRYFSAIDKNSINYLSYGTYMSIQARSRVSIDDMVNSTYKNYIENIQEKNS